MNCTYLDFNGKCRSSPVYGGIYNPTPEEKANYCTNDSEMRCCPRLQIYQSHLEATGRSARVSNINTNTNTNTNTNNNSSNLSVDVKDAFELVYTMVEGKKGLSEDEKVEINARISMLEKELGKGQKEIDKSKVERIRQGFEKYGWLIPTIAEIIAKGLGA